MIDSNLQTRNRVETRLTTSLLKKYSINIPRYTSYPTAPEWEESFTQENFLKANRIANELETPISLYFHLPFCESQCYFCGCNVVISKKKSIVDSYLLHLKKEIEIVASLISKNRVVEQIHLGGGTPTYFNPTELKSLFSYIQESFTISRMCETGIEIDPRVTTGEHVKTLSGLGFNRLSMGIQDFDLKVQEAINRVQPYEKTEEIFSLAREFGFESINVDLVYGLPYQSKESFAGTISLVLKLNPDRIALFHYAHLPQILFHQAKYIPSSSLPDSLEKIEIFQYAVESFINNGYVFIGLDHFAKPQDELTIAKKNKTLHRNFQGYTTKSGCDLYGFGISAISNVQNTYSQNIRKLNPYYDTVEVRHGMPLLPIFRGIVLNKDDEIRKEVIMKILCQGEVIKKEIEEKYKIDFSTYFSSELERLKDFEEDGLVVLGSNVIQVTLIGQFFLRNIASVFDACLQGKNGKQRIFSKSL